MFYQLFFPAKIPGCGSFWRELADTLPMARLNPVDSGRIITGYSPRGRDAVPPDALPHCHSLSSELQGRYNATNGFRLDFQNKVLLFCPIVYYNISSNSII